MRGGGNKNRGGDRGAGSGVTLTRCSRVDGACGKRRSRTPRRRESTGSLDDEVSFMRAELVKHRGRAVKNALSAFGAANNGGQQHSGSPDARSSKRIKDGSRSPDRPGTGSSRTTTITNGAPPPAPATSRRKVSLVPNAETQRRRRRSLSAGDEEQRLPRARSGSPEVDEELHEDELRSPEQQVDDSHVDTTRSTTRTHQQSTKVVIKARPERSPRRRGQAQEDREDRWERDRDEDRRRREPPRDLRDKERNSKRNASERVEEDDRDGGAPQTKKLYYERDQSAPRSENNEAGSNRQKRATSGSRSSRSRRVVADAAKGEKEASVSERSRNGAPPRSRKAQRGRAASAKSSAAGSTAGDEQAAADNDPRRSYSNKSRASSPSARGSGRTARARPKKDTTKPKKDKKKKKKRNGRSERRRSGGTPNSTRNEEQRRQVQKKEAGSNSPAPNPRAAFFVLEKEYPRKEGVEFLSELARRVYREIGKLGGKLKQEVICLASKNAYHGDSHKVNPEWMTLETDGTEYRKLVFCEVPPQFLRVALCALYQQVTFVRDIDGTRLFERSEILANTYGEEARVKQLPAAARKRVYSRTAIPRISEEDERAPSEADEEEEDNGGEEDHDRSSDSEAGEERSRPGRDSDSHHSRRHHDGEDEEDPVSQDDAKSEKSEADSEGEGQEDATSGDGDGDRIKRGEEEMEIPLRRDSEPDHDLDNAQRTAPDNKEDAEVDEQATKPSSGGSRRTEGDREAGEGTDQHPRRRQPDRDATGQRRAPRGGDNHNYCANNNGRGQVQVEGHINRRRAPDPPGGRNYSERRPRRADNNSRDRRGAGGHHLRAGDRGQDRDRRAGGDRQAAMSNGLQRNNNKGKGKHNYSQLNNRDRGSGGAVVARSRFDDILQAQENLKNAGSSASEGEQESSAGAAVPASKQDDAGGARGGEKQAHADAANSCDAGVKDEAGAQTPGQAEAPASAVAKPADDEYGAAKEEDVPGISSGPAASRTTRADSRNKDDNARSSAGKDREMPEQTGGASARADEDPTPAPGVPAPHTDEVDSQQQHFPPAASPPNAFSAPLQQNQTEINPAVMPATTASKITITRAPVEVGRGRRGSPGVPRGRRGRHADRDSRSSDSRSGHRGRGRGGQGSRRSRDSRSRDRNRGGGRRGRSRGRPGGQGSRRRTTRDRRGRGGRDRVGGTRTDRPPTVTGTNDIPLGNLGGRWRSWETGGGGLAAVGAAVAPPSGGEQQPPREAYSNIGPPVASPYLTLKEAHRRARRIPNAIIAQVGYHDTSEEFYNSRPANPPPAATSASASTSRYAYAQILTWPCAVAGVLLGRRMEQVNRFCHDSGGCAITVATDTECYGAAKKLIGSAPAIAGGAAAAASSSSAPTAEGVLVIVEGSAVDAVGRCAQRIADFAHTALDMELAGPPRGNVRHVALGGPEVTAIAASARVCEQLRYWLGVRAVVERADLVISHSKNAPAVATAAGALEEFLRGRCRSLRETSFREYLDTLAMRDPSPNISSHSAISTFPVPPSRIDPAAALPFPKAVQQLPSAKSSPRFAGDGVSGKNNPPTNSNNSSSGSSSSNSSSSSSGSLHRGRCTNLKGPFDLMDASEQSQEQEDVLASSSRNEPEPERHFEPSPFDSGAAVTSGKFTTEELREQLDYDDL